VFEFLLRDTAFMGKIDNAICLFIEEDLMQYKHIPQLVKSLMDILASQVLNGGLKKKLEREIQCEII